MHLGYLLTTLSELLVKLSALQEKEFLYCDPLINADMIEFLKYSHHKRMINFHYSSSIAYFF